MTRRRRESLPVGGHSPQHITPDPAAPHNKKKEDDK